MEELLFKLALNLPLNITLMALCILSYLFNYVVLKLKKEYRGLHYQIFLVLLLPFFNLIFLAFNLILGCTYGAGYKVVKPRKRAKAKTGRTVKA